MVDVPELHKLLTNTKTRLKLRYGWEDDFVNSAVNEYHRFLLLHLKNPKTEIVPGKVVDKVWHDHILHTQSYMNFCEKMFGYYLHHHPDDASSKKSGIDLTLILYEKTFGHKAPSQYWSKELPPKKKEELSVQFGCSCK